MEEGDNSWVFDSLVCFLNGPVWNAPLQSFIEEKSLTFETNSNDNNEYLKIFEEYKNLVDLMLGSYMEDIGIAPAQFEDACNKGQLEYVPKSFDNTLFEQIWAANDFDMFKRMMIQRNVELQLQALELIEQKYGVTPQSFIPHKEVSQDAETGAGTSGVKHEKSNGLEEEIMEEVIKTFPFEDTVTPEEPDKVEEEKQYLQEEKHILQEALKCIEENSKAEVDAIPTISIGESENAHVGSGKMVESIKSSQGPTQQELSFDKKPISTEIDRLELKKRQEYLRAQRDKLVALKKEVRKKHLVVGNAADSKDKFKNRPTSAKVAEAVLAGNSTKIEPQQLLVRKALADRLRSEVITHKEEV